MSRFFTNDRSRSSVNQSSAIGELSLSEALLASTDVTDLIPINYRQPAQKGNSQSASPSRAGKKGTPEKQRTLVPVEVVNEHYSAPSRSIAVKAQPSKPRDINRADWMSGPVPLERIPRTISLPSLESWGDGPKPGVVERVPWEETFHNEKVPLQMTRKDMPPPGAADHLAARLASWSAKDAVKFYRGWLRCRPKKSARKKRRKGDKAEEAPKEPAPKKRMKRSWTVPGSDGARLNEKLYVTQRACFSKP